MAKSQETRIHQLANLHGRLVQWNKDEVAEIVEAWAFMEPEKLGDTVVGYEPNAYSVFRRPNGMLVTKSLQHMTLLEAKPV